MCHVWITNFNHINQAKQFHMLVFLVKENTFNFGIDQTKHNQSL